MFEDREGANFLQCMREQLAPIASPIRVLVETFDHATAPDTDHVVMYAWIRIRGALRRLTGRD